MDGDGIICGEHRVAVDFLGKVVEGSHSQQARRGAFQGRDNDSGCEH